MTEPRPPTNTMRKVLHAIYAVVFFMVLAGVLLGPVGGSGHSYALKSAAVQSAHTIGVCLYQYSVDHNGHYPDGRTSTEVFQHLIDKNYVTDPSIFYFNLGHQFPGKVRPTSSHLKAENVCWDATCCIDSSAPEGLPVVFLTGYQVTYRAGASAKPLVQLSVRNWFKQWLDSGVVRSFTVIASTSSTATWGKGISARLVDSQEDGTIPNFIPADFDAKGKTYRQLVP